MEKIVILTSTRHLRQPVREIDRTVETLSPAKCRALAEEYDLVIVGSRASDDFYERIKSALPKKVLGKFRLYPRSFFDQFKHRGDVEAGRDDRDEGWKEILQANGIRFVVAARILTGQYEHEERTFHWTRLADFIRDDRVTVLGE